MPNVLVGMCLYRGLRPSIESILSQQYSLGKLDYHFCHKGYTRDQHGFQNITEKLNAIRNVFLKGNYDYLILVEDDNVLDHTGYFDNMVTIVESNNPEIQVLYTPTVFRNASNNHSFCIEMYPDSASYITGELVPEYYRDALASGFVYKCDGIGFNCTLITRQIVEEIPFRLQTEDELAAHIYKAHADTLFAIDCKMKGVRSYIAMSLPIGHISSDESTAFVMYPDATKDNFVRKVEIH